MFIWQGIASTEIWMGEKISEKIELEKVKKVLKLELC
jgi:shikimate 5-dehydrogenase